MGIYIRTIPYFPFWWLWFWIVNLEDLIKYGPVQFTLDARSTFVSGDLQCGFPELIQEGIKTNGVRLYVFYFYQQYGINHWTWNYLWLTDLLNYNRRAKKNTVLFMMYRYPGMRSEMLFWTVFKAVWHKFLSKLCYFIGLIIRQCFFLS